MGLDKQERLEAQLEDFMVDQHGHPVIEPRDKFAMAAMAALISNADTISIKHGFAVNEARIAYGIADAMLEARNWEGRL